MEAHQHLKNDLSGLQLLKNKKNTKNTKNTKKHKKTQKTQKNARTLGINPNTLWVSGRMAVVKRIYLMAKSKNMT
jgi:hypothetical protein